MQQAEALYRVCDMMPYRGAFFDKVCCWVLSLV